GAISIAIDPQNTNVIYVGTQWDGLVLKTIDGGASWVTTGLAASGSLIDALCIGPGGQVYASVRFRGFYSSADGGATWHKEFLPDTVDTVFDFVFRQATIYVATEDGIYVKDPNGLWFQFDQGLSNNYFVAIRLDPRLQNVYVGVRKLDGTHGGMFVRKLVAP
ncbi:MAG: hypothetical protein O7D34_09820, partial [Ignavibacteria bacterium]|nr:hypothetical protein [Ignavibacteria bacterium]